MWIYLPFGFYSIVQKSGEDDLTVRARLKSDLDVLRAKYMPTLGPDVGKATDYEHRARISHADFAQGLKKIAEDLHYSNVKSETMKQSGAERHSVYAKVHHATAELAYVASSPVPTGNDLLDEFALPANARYGGVVFDKKGRVLLRKPTDEFDGYVWTFAKGRCKPGETPHETAARETREETGLEVEVGRRIPGLFRGGTGMNVYFLMEPIEDHQDFDPKETEEVRWVTPDEARELIGKTRNQVGRKRDLAVLDAALGPIYCPNEED